MLKLYWNGTCAPCRAVHLLLLEENLPFELHSIDLQRGDQFKADFVTMNPNHEVPVLDDSGFILYESSAILRYLCAKFQTRIADHWYPQSCRKRALVNEYLDWHQEHLRKSSYGCLKVSVNSRMQKQDSEINKELFQREHILLEVSLNYLEQQLEKSRWIAGDEISIADLQASCEISETRLWKEDLSRYPKLSCWLLEMEKLPHWKEANKAYVDHCNFVWTHLKWQ